jgi:hypothetical protein
LSCRIKAIRGTGYAGESLEWKKAYAQAQRKTSQNNPDIFYKLRKFFYLIKFICYFFLSLKKITTKKHTEVCFQMADNE